MPVVVVEYAVVVAGGNPASVDAVQISFGKRCMGKNVTSLVFDRKVITAAFLEASGKAVEKQIEIRTNPITGRTCRITYARAEEKEAGTQRLPSPPPDADKSVDCPFCKPYVFSKTPMIHQRISQQGRLSYGKSLLFPNLFPYGSYSAVSLFDDIHFVEIGTATASSYANSFKNCSRYLRNIFHVDPVCRYMAITQNHLPSAGGSLIHPHLQIQADSVPANFHRFLEKRSAEYYQKTGRHIFSDYLDIEKQAGLRYIGKTGGWEWIASFAPEGFYEIWAILPGHFSMTRLEDNHLDDLAIGIVNTQKFYRSLCRNGYNLGILSIEDENSFLELTCRFVVRSNYDAWTRNDHSGFEVMLGDMATFSSPEETAGQARVFWD